VEAGQWARDNGGLATNPDCLAQPSRTTGALPSSKASPDLVAIWRRMTSLYSPDERKTLRPSYSNIRSLQQLTLQ
jgi:hypothetical protein